MMQTSGPIRKTQKDLEIRGDNLSIIETVAKNIWKASVNGKFWLLKGATEDSAESRELLKREYALSCNLSHPYIATTYNFIEQSPIGPAILIEFVEGRTLKEFILEKPPRALKRRILDEILEAVDYLHAKGILHNDIKLENIMISHIGDHVKLLDFGLSESESDPLTRRLGGTPGFSAPEVLSGDLSTLSDASSDIWSLGMIILSLFPKRYSLIVKKCLNRETKKRYRSVVLLKKDLTRRDRYHKMAALVLVLLLLASAVIFPKLYIEQMHHKEQIAKEEVEKRIEREINDLWAPYLDSLNNCKWREPALQITGHFINSFREYRLKYSQSPDMVYFLPLIDATYDKLCNEHIRPLFSLPSFHNGGH